jgi:hypothetical protein
MIPIVPEARVARAVRGEGTRRTTDPTRPTRPRHGPRGSASAAGPLVYRREANAVADPAQSEANPGEGPRPRTGIAGRMAAAER